MKILAALLIASPLYAEPSLEVTAAPIIGHGQDTLLLSDYFVIPHNISRRITERGFQLDAKLETPVLDDTAFIVGLNYKNLRTTYHTGEDELGVWLGQEQHVETFSVRAGLKVYF